MSSSDEEEVQPKGRRGAGKAKDLRKKKAPQIVEIPYDEAASELEKLHRLLANADDGSSAALRHRRTDISPPKVKIDISWPSVCASLEKQAGLHGVSNEIMEIIWEIVKHPASPAVIAVKTQLIFCMIPIEDIVPTDIVEKIIYSISNSNDKTGAEKIKLTLLKYLVGIHEYNLCDASIFNYDLYYDLIFHATRHDSLIPWVCHFIKRITKRESIRRNYILDLLDLMMTPLSGGTMRAVVALLRLYKLLRPDLLPNSVFKFHAVGEGRTLDLRPAFRKSLFEAKSRLLGIGTSLLHIPNPEEDMEMDDVQPAKGKEHILSVLNADCFPEFKLYLEGDVDDVRMWPAMHKRDFMRCALKKVETLPLLVKDAAAMEEFNTFVSLVFQHKFNSYDVKQRRRHNFILQRCVSISMLQGMGIPAVNDWILNFLLTWDGVLFKSHIFYLLPYMTPINFEDGYMYVLLKLEGMFLDGDDFDRIQIWRILEDLFIKWTGELLADINAEVNRGVLEVNRKSLQLFFEYINALVCKYASIDGHRDEIFLVCACESYIKFAQTFNEVKKPPFYVLPPPALWYMVVLSDSIVPINAFCKFATSIDPKVLKHLRKTPQHAILLSWTQCVWPDMHRYFGYNLDQKVLFAELFQMEIAILSDVVLNEEEKHSPAVIHQCQAYARMILDKCHALVAVRSRAMALIMKDVNKLDRLGTNIDLEKAKKLAPFVLEILNFFEGQKGIQEAGVDLNESYLD